jgi:ABC-2 type transport system ATP-binding protein
MNQAVISLDHLTRDFETVRAVDDLTLEVPPGIIFGFLGPNGAGKTTTIRMLLGLLPPTGGKVRVLGYDIATQAEQVREHTGALLEHTGIYEQMTAEDNLEFFGRAYRLPPSERGARIQELLKHLGLWDRRKDRAGKWSRGMKQKLALARALMHRPPLVLLDEPTAGLDVQAAVAIREDLKSLAARDGVTVFLTTHNMSEAEKLCERVAVIRQGRLVAVGHPDELRASAGSPRVEVFGRNFNQEAQKKLRMLPEVLDIRVQNGRMEIDLDCESDPSQLVNLLVSAGVQVLEVHRGKASLEEVFLTLMEEEK